MNMPITKFLIFAAILLASCTPEKPVTINVKTVTATTTVAITAEITSAITPSPVAAKDCTRGDTMEEIESGGQTRQYLLHVPATYKPEEPGALVLVFHGAGISAERFVGYSRFSNVADREGFLVVYPQGLNEAWNPGRDVGFISDLIDRLETRCNIDPNRIYASGHSNGASMVNRLACELAGRVAAIGVLSGGYSASEGCSPSRPVAVFAIHGTADPIIPYDGVPEWALAWAERNGCDPQPAEVIHNVLISEKQWGNCRADADVILYTIQDHEHDWPTELIDAGQIIWDFFEAHPLKAETP